MSTTRSGDLAHRGSRPAKSPLAVLRAYSRTVTEVPEHLLRRSRERREALGLATSGGGDGGSGSAAPSSSTAVDVPASSAAPAPTAGPAPAAPPAAPPDVPEYVPPPPPPPPRRSRVPMWVLPVLAFLPLWAILYAGSFGDRTPVNPNDPAVLGARIYRSSGCSGCHGPTGGGGVGPPMKGVKATFPDEVAHVDWIKSGSKPFAGQPYGASGRVATGGMPGFGDSLSEDEIRAVVLYERNVLDR